MKNAFDLQHPFFVPVWRRVVVVLVCFGWAGVEYSRGAPAWAVIFAAAGAWCVYQFFVLWQPPDEE